MKFEYRNVCEVVVKNDMCIGCGLCAAVCPVQVLRMEFNTLGEYQAVEFKEGCLPTCNLCLEVCPFWDRNPNEDDLAGALFSQQPDIEKRPETGFYLEGFAGYSNVNDQRENGAAGGVTTWLLETLLERGVIDHVICVTSNPDPARLFKFGVFSSIQEVRAASRSCYYPVELSEVVRYIMENEGKYAITGLPCFIKGVRLAMRRFPKLQRRVILLFGLVCSQTQSKRYAEQLVQLKGGDPATVVKATFRVKDPHRPANDYGFRYESLEGKHKEGAIFFKEGLGEVWLNEYFTPNACRFCDDVFAETADVTLMDAWLPGLQQDPRGHNLILVRSQAIADALRAGNDSQALTLAPMPVDALIASQKGGLVKKRKTLALRIARQPKNPPPEYIPRKRPVSAAGLELKDRLLFELRERIRRQFRATVLRDPTFSTHSLRLAPLRLAIFVMSKTSFLFRLLRKVRRMLDRGRGERPAG